MADSVFALAAITLILALVGGLTPLFGKMKGDPSQLKMTNLIIYEGFLILGCVIFCLIPFVIRKIERKDLK